METFDELKEIWSKNRNADPCKSLTSDYVDHLISDRIRKVKSTFREYFWVSFFYQNLVYACLVFLIAKFYSTPGIVMLSVAGIMLYIPLTIVFMKKFKSAFLINKEGVEFSDDDIYLNMKNSHARMSEYFRFKKKFDWVIVPLNCVLIVVINFILFVPGGLKGNLAAGIILLIVWHIIFVIAIRIENKKKFVEPLRQMEEVLEEME
jgi:hypothetical protein